ncbi:hypothetical protein BESB_044370 [Besnoitia besnoiti]|uniref:Uncharacterized protein n=1 Tax=Besnoitia besnoiti TaxID=94643 RepID=A0A2A9ME27_BESBE|nr:hypothetical protein BESB_044370 [Besnoitia besnoiti]PFH36245.1 hypothetical protein BESB_044370 [Besnoitia besnoiti]
MPPIRANSAGARRKAKWGQGRKSKGKSLPPRPDLKFYPGHKGPLARQGAFSESCIDDQIAASATMLKCFSPLVQPSGLPPRILLGMRRSPRLAPCYSPSSPTDARSHNQTAFPSRHALDGEKPKDATADWGSGLSRRLNRQDSHIDAATGALAAPAPASMMAISICQATAAGGGANAAATLMGEDAHYGSRAHANAGSTESGVTVRYVKASNISTDPRFLEMQEVLSRYKEQLDSSAAPYTSVRFSTPPTRRFQTEARWELKVRASKGGEAYSDVDFWNAVDGLESFVRASSSASPSLRGPLLSGRKHPSAFWNPKSYQSCGGIPTEADAAARLRAFADEIQSRLREILSCRDTYFRLAQLDSVYAWFCRERAIQLRCARPSNGDRAETIEVSEKTSAAVSDNSAVLPPLYPPPLLPSASDAFDAAALASCEGSAFYDPTLWARSPAVVGDAPVSDCLNDDGAFQNSTRREQPPNRDRESGRSSASSVGSCRRSSLLSAASSRGQIAPSRVSQPESRTAESEGGGLPGAESEEGGLPGAERSDDDPRARCCKRPHTQQLGNASSLAFVQDHAPLITPSDYLLELDTRELLPPGEADDLIGSWRLRVLPQSNVCAQRQEKSASSPGCLGRRSIADRPDGSQASAEANADTSDRTWAETCSRKYQGDLQQRYLRDRRKLRPPWGMTNIHAVSSFANNQDRGAGDALRAPPRPSTRFERSGLPQDLPLQVTSYAYAGEKKPSVAEKNLEERWLIRRHRDVTRMRQQTARKEVMGEWCRRRSLLLARAQRNVDEIRSWKPKPTPSTSSSESSSEAEEGPSAPPAAARDSGPRWSIDSRRASNYFNSLGWRAFMSVIAKRESQLTLRGEARNEEQRSETSRAENRRGPAADSDGQRAGSDSDSAPSRSSSDSARDADDLDEEDEETEKRVADAAPEDALRGLPVFAERPSEEGLQARGSLSPQFPLRSASGGKTHSPSLAAPSAPGAPLRRVQSVISGSALLRQHLTQTQEAQLRYAKKEEEASRELSAAAASPPRARLAGKDDGIQAPAGAGERDGQGFLDSLPFSPLPSASPASPLNMQLVIAVAGRRSAEDARGDEGDQTHRGRDTSHESESEDARGEPQDARERRLQQDIERALRPPMKAPSVWNSDRGPFIPRLLLNALSKPRKKSVGDKKGNAKKPR